MALCLDHPLCYRNNSTTIKKYGYNSKVGSNPIAVKYGSETRYYITESSSATSNNKLATISGGIKRYVNNGYVDVSLPIHFYNLKENTSGGGRSTYYVGLGNTGMGTDLFGTGEVTINNDGIKASISVVLIKNVWSTGGESGINYSYTITFPPETTSIIYNRTNPCLMASCEDITSLTLSHLVFQITVKNGNTVVQTFNVTFTPTKNSEGKSQSGTLTFRISI